MKATGERFIPDMMNGIIEANHLNRYYFVTNQFDLNEKIILDIASGEGYGSSILAKHAKYVYGIDIDNETISHARLKYKAQNLQYIQGSATEIPIESNTIDIVVSFETIEHHDKHEEMMCEIKRVLKHNGILIISSPNKKEYTDKSGQNNPYHVKELYTEEFRKLVSVYFSNTKMFWQRYVDGSVILPVDNSINCDIPMDILDGTAKCYDSIYDIIIATNTNDDFRLPYYCTIYPLNIHNEINKKYKSVLNSHAFKLGCFLLKPIYFIKKIWKIIKLR